MKSHSKNLRGISRFLCLLCVMLRFASSASAQSWQRLGPEGGTVVSLATGADGTTYLGTADGHIFAAAAGSIRWELRGRAGNRVDSVVQHLIVDRANSKRIFAAVWTQDPLAGGGIFRSDDGGKIWRSAGLRAEAVRAMEQSASTPQILIAGTRSGVFRSNDLGGTWERISPEGDEELRNLDSIAIDPRDANVIYAGTYHLPWKTVDGGKTWKPIADGMIDDSDVMSIHIDSRNPERIFASACSGIYRSENGGANWTKLAGIPYSSRRTEQIAQDPTNPDVLYAATTEGVWRTADSGESWRMVTPRDWSVNAVTFRSAAQGAEILLGTEQLGIERSSDSGSTFVQANGGFSHRVLSKLVADSNDTKHLFALAGGMQERIWESKDSGSTWSPMTGALPAGGAKSIFELQGVLFASLRSGGAAAFDGRSDGWKRVSFLEKKSIGATNAKGATVLRSVERLLPAPPQINQMASQAGRIFAASSQGLWSGGLREGKLRRISETELAGEIVALSANSTELLAASTTTLARSRDAGKSWQVVALPIELGRLQWIEPTPQSPDELIGGTGRGVWKLQWRDRMTCRLMQSGLPGTESVVPLLSNGLWVVSMRKGGTYISQDGGENWTRVDSESESGGLSSLLQDGRDGFLGSSLSEGVLRWVEGKGK